MAYRPTVYRTGTLGEQIVLICFGPIRSEIIWWIRYVSNLQAKREINELKSTGAFKETKLKDLQEKNSEIEKFYETEGAQWKTKFEETSKLKKEQTSRIVEMKDLVQVNKLKYFFLCENTIGILLAKLFWLTVIKNCSSDQEKLLKFEAEGQFFILLEQFIWTEKVRNNFWNRMLFKLIPGGFSYLIHQNNYNSKWYLETYRKI